ncbi:antA/AntB antirepressor family protein [Levilactobacillus brevis]|uniref:antA/AntB antirepressor family protein n=1 Tax=Levilactobacillus brevis TaxID=1580 RepID=UPI0011639739|nr:antA/AntB antirepressor family protein [Levilactobacillus brevis]QCZ43786.1 uncharacterized protein UCCLBBS124_1462 [Levilactobacillus brevis]
MTDYGFVEGKDFSPLSGKSRGGRPRIEYAMALDMAKEVSMIQRTPKGKQAASTLSRWRSELSKPNWS